MVSPLAPASVFVPPSLPGGRIPRPRLEVQASPWPAAALTLVVGPPGAGKSTLARAWFDTFDGDRAWINLDARIGRSGHFWPAFVQAVQLARPDLELAAIERIGAEPFEGAEAVLAIIDDLIALDPRRPLVVVLDDAHELSADTWQELHWLLGHLPPGLRLVVASRADPPFSLARMRANGELAEYGPSDLSLTAAETLALFEQAGEPMADRADLAHAVYHRTEGWMAGVQLALLAGRRGAAADELLARFNGIDRTVAELLQAEVLDRQTDDVRGFLRSVSVLVVLEPSLCAAITERADAGRLLERLASQPVFVNRLDGPVERYRLHPMLAELLRHELRREQPGAETALHSRAAAWFEVEGRVPEAIEHAIAAGDHATALDLVTGHLAKLCAVGHRRDVMDWLEAIPVDYSAADPDRAVEYCAAMQFVVRRNWMAALDRAWAAVGDDRPDLRAQLHLITAVAWAGQGRLDRFLDEVEVATRLAPEPPRWLYDEVIELWHTRLLAMHGHHDEAVERARAFLYRDRQLVTDPPAHSILAAVLRAAGDDGALGVARKAVELWQAMGEPELFGMFDALWIVADAEHKAGHHDDAEGLATTLIAIASEPPANVATAAAAVTMATIDAAAGHTEEAAARLRDVYDQLRVTDADPRVLAWIEAQPSFSAAAVGSSGALTEREATILEHLQSHLTLAEIGNELFISRYTVKTHVMRIYRKFGVRTRSAAIHEARRRGLLPPTPFG